MQKRDGTDGKYLTLLPIKHGRTRPASQSNRIERENILEDDESLAKSSSIHVQFVCSGFA